MLHINNKKKWSFFFMNLSIVFIIFPSISYSNEDIAEAENEYRTIIIKKESVTDAEVYINKLYIGKTKSTKDLSFDRITQDSILLRLKKSGHREYRHKIDMGAKGNVVYKNIGYLLPMKENWELNFSIGENFSSYESEKNENADEVGEEDTKVFNDKSFFVQLSSYQTLTPTNFRHLILLRVRKKIKCTFSGQFG